MLFSFLRATFFSLFAVIPLSIIANPVSETVARQKALDFVKKRNSFVVTTLQRANLQTISHARRAEAVTPATPAYSDESSLYVFNVGADDGFVIVSGDDRTPEILGYADSGSLTSETMPPALQWMLEGYEQQMEWLEEKGNDMAYESRFPQKAPARTAIAPMIKTRWNQGVPYNKECPIIGNDTTVTGCVATSMAQLMYYHQWPKTQTTAIPGYTTDNKLFTLEGLNATTFDWDNMTLTYSSTATGDAADAVAELMQYCGVALQMNYNTSDEGGSSAFSELIPYALKTYFGYDDGVHHAYRKNYSYADWVSLIYSELAAERPVALGGQATGGGHSFVCDGYQGDDYFHINWGWGGSSDGYFRLSVLQPWEQGIGGSSTLDGFSYSQNAVLGIQPPVDGNKDYCLSLEGLHLGSPNTKKSSKTFNRDEETDGFTGISLYFLVYCYHHGSNAFDYAVQMVDENGDVVQTFYTEENKTMVWNEYNKGENGSGKGRTISDITIPSTVDDGTYYIKVVSRPNGTTIWQECFDGEAYKLTAVISGDQLTINVPITATVLPTNATFAVSGNLTQGYEQTVTASITGGSVDYHGNVVLRVNNKAVMGKTLDIPAGQTVDAHYSFIPTDEGNNVLTLYNSKTGGTQIGGTDCKTTVNIAASDATDNIDNLSFTATIENQNASGQLYGNALRATIVIGNPSTTNTYVGRMNCSVRKWTITTTDNGDGTISKSATWDGIEYTTYPLTVAKEGTTTMHFATDVLEPTDENTRYSVRISYRNTATEGNAVDGIHLGLDEHGWGSLTVTEGYRIGFADGTTTVHESATTINAGDASFVDMSSLSNTGSITVTPGSNLNCLYLLASNAETPSGLTGKNVVKGSTAETITLTDGKGNDFFSPIDFTAENISYTRTFTREATATGGWNTLYLPFAPTKVIAAAADAGGSDDDIEWFTSDTDTGKDFWLKTMTGDDAGTIYFDHAPSLKANTPYIIALPGDEFGKHKLTGRAITFSAANAAIVPTAKGKINGNSYNFCGSTTAVNLSDVYMLNKTGTRFIKATTATEQPPFRAWIEAANISSLSRMQLIIAEEEINGIETIGTDTPAGNAATFTIDGRRVTADRLLRGLYIRNGKKIVVKR